MSCAAEYELLDTGIFDQNRYFDVVIEYAKAAPEDLLMQVTVHNRGPEDAELHVLPILRGVSAEALRSGGRGAIKRAAAAGRPGVAR